MVVTVDRGFPAFAGREAGHPGVIVFKLADQNAARVEAAMAQLPAATRWMTVGCTVRHGDTEPNPRPDA